MGSSSAPRGNTLAAIEDIAGLSVETGLLAINAVAEAARAGERGRPVAQMAQRVLALSGRTARVSHRLRQCMASGGRAAAPVHLACGSRHSLAATCNELRQLNEAVLAVIAGGAPASGPAAVDSLMQRVADRVGSLEALIEDVAQARPEREPALPEPA